MRSQELGVRLLTALQTQNGITNITIMVRVLQPMFTAGSVGEMLQSTDIQEVLQVS